MGEDDDCGFAQQSGHHLATIAEARKEVRLVKICMADESHRSNDVRLPLGLAFRILAARRHFRLEPVGWSGFRPSHRRVLDDLPSFPQPRTVDRHCPRKFPCTRKVLVTPPDIAHLADNHLELLTRDELAGIGHIVFEMPTRVLRARVSRPRRPRQSMPSGRRRRT
jgi:hypothetical protein